MRMLLVMEMNETIHVISHIEEEFMREDVGMYFSSNSDDKRTS